MTLSSDEQRALATARLLTAALAMSCVAYVLIGFLAAGRVEAAPAAGRPLMVVALLMMAAMGVLAAPFVRSAMLRGSGARSLASWFVSVIVSQALREGAAVIGLVLTLLTGQLWPVVTCAAVAIAAILHAFPKEADLGEHLGR